MFEFRSYRPGDEGAITGLFQAAFGRPMSLDFWRWRFLDHPMPGTNIILGYAGETLAAHYAASWAPLSLAGETVSATLSMTTMTSPDFRGRGLFEKSATALYDYMPTNGVRAIYGFPNVASHPLFVSKVGWHDTYEVPALTLDLAALGKVPADDPAVTEVPAIDERFGKLFAAVAPGLPVAGHRDAAILGWRIDRNPENRYTRLVVGEGAEISGYAITKAYGADSTDLVELRAADIAAARALIGSVIARAVAAGHKRVSTWCMPRETHRLTLEAAGFKAGGPVTYFGGRTFLPLSSDLSDGRLWRISMLDSDLY